MRSILFFLLSVCYVIVSGKQVKVYVKQILPDHKTLEFKGNAEEEKTFTLGEATTGDDVKLNDNMTITEKSLEIRLVAKTASILEAVQPEISLSGACNNNDDCMELKNSAEYTIQASQVMKDHDKMTCTEKGETKGTEFPLDHASSDDATKIPVVGGEITQHTIQLDFKPEKCVISKDGESVPANQIELELSKQCPANCITLKKSAEYIIEASQVEKDHDKMKCTEKGASEGTEFVLEHDGQKDAAKIPVAGGVISQQTIQLEFKPEKCVIFKVGDSVPENQIQLELSTSCTANCIGLKTSAEYTIQASQVKKDHDKMTCTEKGETKGTEFVLDHASSDDATKIPVDAAGVISQHTIQLDFKPEKCVIFKDGDSVPENQIKLELSTSCTANCIALKKLAEYNIAAKNVHIKQLKLTCTEKGETKGTEFPLDHASSNDATKIPVVGGEITQHTIQLDFKPETCIIEAAVLAKKIEIPQNGNCDAENANCFQNIEDGTDEPDDDANNSDDDANNSDSAYETTLTLSLITICVFLGNML